MASALASPYGYISSVADNFVLAYPGGSYKNVWYNTYDTRSDYAESKTLGDILNALGDGRSAVTGTNPSARFPYGLTRTDAINFDLSTGGNYSKVLAASKRAENSPTTILGSSLVLLALAEGAERGWVAGGTAAAQTWYEAGVTASYSDWGVAVPGTYLTTGPANYLTGAGAPGNVGANSYNSIKPAQNAATTSKMARIQLQYYLAAYPNGNESWANWRRTGVPNLLGTNFATNAGGAIPRRYVYGVTEGSLNGVQLAVAVGRLPGGDTQDSRIWWDQ